MNTSALKKHSAGERSPAVNPVPTSTGGQGWVVRLPEAPQRARTSPNSLGAGGTGVYRILSLPFWTAKNIVITTS